MRTTMKIIKMTIAIVAALVAQICFERNASAQPMQGSINSYGWSFNWSVMSTSGLQISNLRHNSVSFMARGSLPALRVKYEQFCGPYLDRIKWDNILPDELGNKVRVTENGDWLTVWVRAQIASYALTQAWWFHKTLGLMVPEVGSSGLQCENNHRHHPYWRFDFDVVTA